MHVFVYGTLTDAERAAAVVDEFRFAGEATLSGLHRVDGSYPTLAPGGRVSGRVLVTPDVAALDAYEGVERGLYVRVTVPCVSEDVDSLALYVGDPDALGVTDRVVWPGSGPFRDRVERYVETEGVSSRIRPG